MMNPGDSVTWTCTYDNDNDPGLTLTFGQSATTNEMCIYEARYFPRERRGRPSTCGGAPSHLELADLENVISAGHTGATVRHAVIGIDLQLVEFPRGAADKPRAVSRAEDVGALVV